MTKSRTRIILSACIVAVAFIVAFFSYNPAEEPAAAEVAEDQQTDVAFDLPEDPPPDDIGLEPDADGTDLGADAGEPVEESPPLYTTREDATIFDFADLPEADFIRGVWTVNQLIARYGAPESVKGNYFPGYDIVFTNVWLDDVYVAFWLRSAEDFSFYDDSLGENGFEAYDLGESDMDFELEVFALSFAKDTVEFPHGIRIGESTRPQIVEAYGEEPCFVFMEEPGHVDQIDYRYCFYDEQGEPEILGFGPGRIAFLFDENDVLSGAQVEYWLFDL